MERRVGIPQLKAEASALVVAAEAGESVVVTRRGHEVARLVPARRVDGADAALREAQGVSWSGAATGSTGGGAAGRRPPERVRDRAARPRARVIAYLDTSALVKLFVEERHSDRVRGIVGGSPVAVSALGRVEARAAFARVRTGGRLPTPEAEALAAAFEGWWRHVAVVEPTSLVLERAATLADDHALRGYDAVHLASALELPAMQRPVFACFGGELSRAAEHEGLSVPGGW